MEEGAREMVVVICSNTVVVVTVMVVAVICSSKVEVVMLTVVGATCRYRLTVAVGTCMSNPAMALEIQNRDAHHRPPWQE